MFENKARENNRQFMIEWSIINLVGWIVGCLLVVSILQSTLEARYHHSFPAWKEMLIWLPLGISIGVFQWLKLRQFGINLFLWTFATALGIYLLATLFSGVDLILYGSNLIPQGRIDLGEYIGKIDIGNNIAILLTSMAILLGGLITSGLQAILIRRIIPKPQLWIRANMLGFLLPVVIMSLAYFFKGIGLTMLYFFRLYFFAAISVFLLDVFVVLLISIGISLHTGKILIETINASPNS